MKIRNQKGVSLLLTILIMVALLVIALGVSRLTIREIKLSRDISKSFIAYYAADSGIERAVYEERQEGGAVDIPDCPGSGSIVLDNGSSYGIVVKPDSIEAIGCYDNIRRAIEVSF